MGYPYRQGASASKRILVNKLAGMPDDLVFTFKTGNLRFYESSDLSYRGFFSCRLAIPSLDDYEGYTLELEFNEWEFKESEPFVQHGERYTKREYSEEEDCYLKMSEYEPEVSFSNGSSDEHTASFNDLSFPQLKKNAILRVEEKIEEGYRLLLFVLKIKGTAYYGDTLIERSLYETRPSAILDGTKKALKNPLFVTD